MSYEPYPQAPIPDPCPYPVDPVFGTINIQPTEFTLYDEPISYPVRGKNGHVYQGFCGGYERRQSIYMWQHGWEWVSSQPEYMWEYYLIPAWFTDVFVDAPQYIGTIEYPLRANWVSIPDLYVTHTVQLYPPSTDFEVEPEEEHHLLGIVTQASGQESFENPFLPGEYIVINCDSAYCCPGSEVYWRWKYTMHPILGQYVQPGRGSILPSLTALLLLSSLWWVTAPGVVSRQPKR